MHREDYAQPLVFENYATVESETDRVRTRDKQPTLATVANDRGDISSRTKSASFGICRLLPGRLLFHDYFADENCNIIRVLDAVRSMKRYYLAPRASKPGQTARDEIGVNNGRRVTRIRRVLIGGGGGTHRLYPPPFRRFTRRVRARGQTQITNGGGGVKQNNCWFTSATGLGETVDWRIYG